MLSSSLSFISVIIPCRNESEAIEHCLLSVLRQEPPEGGLEVIVADGMSDDGTREKIEKLKTESRKQTSEDHAEGTTPTLTVIDNPAKIVSTGLNAAIRAAKGNVIVRMDAHTEYAPDYIRNCVEVLQSIGADNVGGAAGTRADSYLQKAVAAAYHSPFSVGGARFHNPDYEGYVDTVTYGCWRKEAFERFGYFDEELVRNQDDEHNLRIVRGGGKIWQSSKIKSWYHPRGSLSALFNQYMQYGYWKVRVIQKHKLPASWRHLVPGTFVFTLLLLAITPVLCLLASWLVRSPHFSSQLSAFGFHAAWFFVAVASCYGLCVFAASVLTAARAQWKLLPVLPPVFACYHFGYGYGFLLGCWDFVVRKQHPRLNLKALTR